MAHFFALLSAVILVLTFSTSSTTGFIITVEEQLQELRESNVSTYDNILFSFL